MKRAKPEVIGTPFLKLYKSTHNINDIYAALNLLYGVLANQLMVVITGKLINAFYKK